MYEQINYLPGCYLPSDFLDGYFDSPVDGNISISNYYQLFDARFIIPESVPTSRDSFEIDPINLSVNSRRGYKAKEVIAMASVAKFLIDPIDLEEEIKRRDDLAECTRHLYFIAARRIQVNGVRHNYNLRRTFWKGRADLPCHFLPGVSFERPLR